MASRTVPRSDNSDDDFESTFEELLDESDFEKNQDIWEDFVDIMGEGVGSDDCDTGHDHKSENRYSAITESISSIKNKSIKEVDKHSGATEGETLAFVKVLNSVGKSKIDSFTTDELDLLVTVMHGDREHINSCDTPDEVSSKMSRAGSPIHTSDTSPGLSRNAEEKIWLQMYNQLFQFHTKFGHSSLSSLQNNPELSKWIREQRFQRKLLYQGKTSTMTPKRISALEEINFSWSYPCNGGDWHLMFEKLKKFKKEHGHCSVPSLYRDDPKLGRWVSQQRHNYKQKSEGIITPMSDDRVFALNSIGFLWRSAKRDNWKTMFHLLSKFQSEHGHCRVPQRSKRYTKMKNWIYKQRQNFRRLQEGKSSPMSMEQVKKLDSIGFIWSMNRYDDWECMYASLVTYFIENGNSAVPVKYAADAKLGRWVSQQRNDRKLYDEGKLSAMTRQRIKMLNNIGFVWVMKHKIQASRVGGVGKRKRLEN